MKRRYLECRCNDVDDRSDETVGQQKFDLLILMLRKLYAFVTGDILEDNADSLMNQEILVPGHLY